MTRLVLARAVCALTLLPLLSACTAHRHSIEWYRDHDRERAQRLAYCKSQDIEESDEDCRNAGLGEAMVRFGGPANPKDF